MLLREELKENNDANDANDEKRGVIMFMETLDMLDALEGYHRFTNGKRLKTTVEKCLYFLQTAGLHFDTIAVQGVSGLVIAAPLVMALDKNLLVVKKPDEKTRYRHDVMGIGEGQKILLIDDCVETGATLRNMVSKIKYYCENPIFVGLFLYTGKYPKGYKFTCCNELIDVITFNQQ